MRLTINALLWAAIFVLLGLLIGLYVAISRGSTAWVNESADALRNSAISRAGDSIEAYLGQGEKVVLRLEAQVRGGECKAVESCLMAALLANPNLTEVTFTEGVQEGFDGRTVLLAAEGRRQVSVYRDTAGEDAPVCTREVTGSGSNFVATKRCRRSHLVMGAVEKVEPTPAMDPTKDDGFTTPARQGMRGRMLKSDLSFSSIDDLLPPKDRRVVLIRILGMQDEHQKLIGVLKVGLQEKEVRQLVASTRVNPQAKDDPYRVFIADEAGRLLTGFGPQDVLVEDDEDLRVKAESLPPEVTAALAHAARSEVTDEKTSAEGRFELDGKGYHVSYRLIADTWGWRIGIVGPEDFYLGHVKRQRAEMMVGMGLVLSLVFFGGVTAVRVLRRALSQIQDETKGMSAFNFFAHHVSSPFAEVRETLHSVEQAKTAVRAMGKYVPIPLVQQLFLENKEPVLGGALREVTIFFSDIEGFTSRAEQEPPDVVAQWLGRYLEVMTTAVHTDQGTVDKFIGDSVMALWNAPNANPEHAALSCQAALRCQAETKKLYASPEWAGRPPLVTRIGLHVGVVMVGHFGAPDRLSYTAIGDSVNLSSRLEGLNKHYGTTILVSEEVRVRARHKFAFRKIDVVAVKGKSKAIAVHELLGPIEDTALVTDEVRRYEQALELYVKGDFVGARALVLQSPRDRPSVVLVERCDELIKTPPPAPWEGISFAQHK